MSRKVLSIVMVIALVFIIAACGNDNGNKASGADGASSNKNVKLVYWNTYYPTIDGNDKSKKREDFYITQAAKRFEAANPGVTVDIQDVPSGEEMFTKFQTASIARNGPDVTTIWSGNYMLRFKQYLEKMNPYFTEEEKSRINGWEAGTENFTSDGDIYGAPASSDGIFVFFYNKALFEKAGIDPVASKPQNIDEFFAMMDKLKAQNITPLALEKGTFWFIPSYWIAQTVTSEGLGELSSGARDFSDPKLIAIADKWSEMHAKGYVTPNDQASQMFLQGQAAMYMGSHGNITGFRNNFGDDLGVIKVPDFSNDVAIHDGGVGGVGATFVVTNYSENKQVAFDFIKFLQSKEEQIEYLKSGEGSITIAKDVDISEYSSDPLVLQIQEWANEPSTIFWPDNIYPAELSSEMGAIETLLSSGKLTGEQFMKKIDEKRNEIVSAGK